MKSQEILAALDQMSVFGRALEAARTVATGLVNAEQVGRELDEAINRKRVELAAIEAAVEHAAQARDVALDDANAMRANAADETAAYKARIEDHAAAFLAEAHAEHDRVRDMIDAKRAEHDGIAEKVAALTAAADAAEARLARADAARRAALEHDDA